MRFFNSIRHGMLGNSIQPEQIMKTKRAKCYIYVLQNIEKQNQMIEIFKYIDKENTFDIPIISITQSNYPISMKSIYELNL